MNEDEKAQGKEPKLPKYVWLISTLAERWAQLFRQRSPFGQGPLSPWHYAVECVKAMYEELSMPDAPYPST